MRLRREQDSRQGGQMPLGRAGTGEVGPVSPAGLRTRATQDGSLVPPSAGPCSGAGAQEADSAAGGTCFLCREDNQGLSPRGSRGTSDSQGEATVTQSSGHAQRRVHTLTDMPAHLDTGARVCAHSRVWTLTHASVAVGATVCVCVHTCTQSRHVLVRLK